MLDNYARAGQEKGEAQEEMDIYNIREDMKEYNMTEEMTENWSVWHMKIKAGPLLYGGGL